MALRFTVATGASTGKPSWWLLDDDGRRIAWAGTFYKSIADAHAAALAFKAGAQGWRYEIYMDDKDQPRWRAKDGKKLVAAGHAPFRTRSEAVTAAHSVSKDTTYASGPNPPTGG
ncbi:MAG: hypothetical protein JWM25_739 [Thermoleophilia bacterium]|nr:hypothetical protein [Thermoleophilia bacterium]